MQVNDIDITVERKGIKHIHLSVYPPDGRVHISAPEQMTYEQVRVFALSRWVWICEKRAEVMQFNRQSEREYVSGEAHYYKGELYRLKVMEMGNKRLKIASPVRIDGDYIVVCVRRKEQAGKALQQWYKEQLQVVIGELMQKWLPRLDLPEPYWEIRSIPNRWGSTNSHSKRILFNRELAKKPLMCIEYIVVHELLHLIERNHTARFYQLLTNALPEWETAKNTLNLLPV